MRALTKFAIILFATFALIALPAFAEPGDTYSDTTRALNEAKKEGAATTKVGGSTIPTGDESSSTGGTGLAPDVTSNARTAKEELRTGSTSTGGTGTTMDEAGEGSTSNTTGTGSMGTESGKPQHTRKTQKH
jgi:hypothetical protein